MSRRSYSHCAGAGFLALLLTAGPVSANDDSRQQQLEQLFQQELVSLERAGNGVRFVFRDRIAKYDARRYQWDNSFTVKPGEQFALRDHHGRVQFTLQAIRSDEVGIEARMLAGGETFTFAVPFGNGAATESD